jgi:hypothetical protein
VTEATLIEKNEKIGCGLKINAMVRAFPGQRPGRFSFTLRIQLRAFQVPLCGMVSARPVLRLPGSARGLGAACRQGLRPRSGGTALLRTLQSPLTRRRGSVAC